MPDNLRAVKLFREHGREIPVGYALDASDAADALRMGFAVARTSDGDQSLLEASEGVRDAFVWSSRTSPSAPATSPARISSRSRRSRCPRSPARS